MREKIIQEAKTWLGTPYHHMGRVKGAGVDCATLLCEVYEAAGLTDHIELDYYPHDWHLHRDEEKYLNNLLKYTHEVEKPDVGDIILYKFGRCFSHGAIYLGNNEIIHSYLGIGVFISSIDDARLHGRDRKYFSAFKE